MPADRPADAAAASRRVPLLPVVGVLVVAAAVVAVVVAFRRGDGFAGPLRIAAGAPGGTYLPLGRGLADVLAEESFPHPIEVLETAGSADNARRLAAGATDLALLQDGTPAGAEVRTVAVLYEEVLHVLVRADLALRDLAGLAGRRVAIGAPESGTAALARALLAHFGVSESDATYVAIGGADLVGAFAAGDLDAAFVLSGLPSPLVRRLLDAGGVHLLSLGDEPGSGSPLDGIATAMPALTPTVVPAHTYGAHPEARVGSVSLNAVLVARRTLPDDVVQQVVAALFAHRVELAAAHPMLARLSERRASFAPHYPLHDGADAYYRRDDPSFFVEYAEPISLGFTLLVALGSAGLALREWLKRRKKNRIDRYYVELEAISTRSHAVARAELPSLRKELLELRRRAFAELVAERLAADQSFTIFQDYLLSELATVEARLEGVP